LYHFFSLGMFVGLLPHQICFSFLTCS
jgi:hypothetical protein